MKLLLTFLFLVGATSFVTVPHTTRRVLTPSQTNIPIHTSEKRSSGIFSTVASAPVRTPETSDRVDAVRQRCLDASVDAQKAKVRVEMEKEPFESDLKSFQVVTSYLPDPSPAPFAPPGLRCGYR